MFELLAKAPSEAWIGLLGVIIGAALSLLGSWLTNKSNIKQLQIQLKHDEQVKNKNLKRERFEELYILLEHWSNRIFSNYLFLDLVVKGQMDYNAYLDKITENTEKQDFKRIEMIINIYGKELKKAYKNVLISLEEYNKIKQEHKKAYENGELTAIHFGKSLTDAQMKIVELKEVLKKQVADAVIHA